MGLLSRRGFLGALGVFVGGFGVAAATESKTNKETLSGLPESSDEEVVACYVNGVMYPLPPGTVQKDVVKHIPFALDSSDHVIYCDSHGIMRIAQEAAVF